MANCWIGIGANQGDVMSAFHSAWNELQDSPLVWPLQRSGLYQTSPVGESSGGAYFNSVLSLSTTGAPTALVNFFTAQLRLFTTAGAGYFGSRRNLWKQ